MIDVQDVRAAVQACQAELERIDSHLAGVASLTVPLTVRGLVQLIQLQDKLRRIGKALGALPGNGHAGPTLFDRAAALPAGAGPAENGQAEGQAGGQHRRRRPGAAEGPGRRAVP
jgi:hypothetical protein